MNRQFREGCSIALSLPVILCLVVVVGTIVLPYIMPIPPSHIELKVFIENVGTNEIKTFVTESDVVGLAGTTQILPMRMDEGSSLEPGDFVVVNCKVISRDNAGNWNLESCELTGSVVR